MARSTPRSRGGGSQCMRDKMRKVMRENAHLPSAHRVAKSLAISRRHCGLPAYKGGKRKGKK